MVIGMRIIVVVVAVVVAVLVAVVVAVVVAAELLASLERSSPFQKAVVVVVGSLLVVVLAFPQNDVLQLPCFYYCFSPFHR